MVGAQPFEQLVRKASTKFFALVGNDVEWGPKATIPFVEDGIRNCVGFFVGQGHEFNIFCQSVCHAQNKLFATVTCFKGPKKVSMDALVWLSWLWQAGEQGGRQAIIGMAQLTSVA